MEWSACRNAAKLRFRGCKMINFADIGLRDNVAQILVLENAGKCIWTQVSVVYLVVEAIQHHLLCAESEGQLVVIANTHILFNPKRGDIKVPIQEHACRISALGSTSSISLLVIAAVRLRNSGSFWRQCMTCGSNMGAPYPACSWGTST